MVHPGLFVGLVLAKKAVAATVYYGLKSYGFGRAYRRILEANKRLMPEAQRPIVQRLTKSAFHAPGKVADIIQNSTVYEFSQKAVGELRSTGLKGRTEASL